MMNNVSKFRQFISKENDSYIRRKKRRLALVFAAGLIFLFSIFTMSLCIGPDLTYSPIDAISMLLSGIGKNFGDQTPGEFVIVNARFPRRLAAMCVGIGLSVAGIAYQAIIRNPLVDSYMLGVSSGAGTFAIGSMIYVTRCLGRILVNQHIIAIFAITGGLLAFFLTITLARCSGSTTNSYILSGVIVSLAFGTIQTIMIIFAGDGILGVVNWLFGSLTEVRIGTLLWIFISVIILTTIIMYFSRELNLVLLGERESQQMGLNVKRFNIIILVLASVLTSFCVAYVGIIGLVGLIVPHFCRILFGGDHRITIPASIFIGGSLMIISDLLTVMIIPGLEFPVGAITMLIGAPVFICLLIKRGKTYNG